MLWIALNGLTSLFAQKGANVPSDFPFSGRGERPAIDLRHVPDSAMVPGQIMVKFRPQWGDFLINQSTVSISTGSARFGISGVDHLNNKYNVRRVLSSFSMALRFTQFNERHLQWGFHLWFTLYIPAGTDLRAMIREYEALDEIEVAEPVYTITNGVSHSPQNKKNPDNDTFTTFIPDDSLFGMQWHYHNTGQTGGTPDADIDLPEAWEITKGDTNVIVAVVDEGIEYYHPDLMANMWPSLGYNFADDTVAIVPGDHGTHVAGTVAANTNNTAGVSGVAGGSGVGNGTRLMSCQVFEPHSPSPNNLPFINAPIWAADHGAAISQNSWWSPTPGVYNQGMLDAIDYFNAYGGGSMMDGGLTVFCAGNSGKPGLYYPCCYSGAFSVASTGHTDRKASYSTYDTWVEIAAPGGDYINSITQEVLSTETNGTYNYNQGTSMACPHVSGVAALILAIAQGNITAQEVREILQYSTDNIDSLNIQYLGKMGAGRLNAYKALQLTPAYIDPTIPKPVRNLTAIGINTSQINLGWQLNVAADSVLVAFSLNGNFGIPGGDYQPGDTITGGGVVLYKGLATSFSHTFLAPATKYHYSLWSKSAENYSVVPIKAQATTLCESILLPFSESFGSIFWPVCWSQQSFGSNALNQWFGSATAMAGGTACEMKSIAQSVNPGTVRLVSPALNTIGLTQLNLSFKHMLDAKAAGAVLRVQSSADGLSWSNELWWVATGDTNIPASTVNTVILSNLNSQTTYIAFTITGDLSKYNNWYIDDVSVTIPTGTPPAVSTTTITTITINSAVCGGNVTLEGTSPVTSRGICRGTSTNPNILGEHTVEGAGAGAFSSLLTGLTPNTLYYVRAYATNATGTSYGSNMTFSTLCDVVNAFPFVEGFENNGAIPSCWTQETLPGSTILWNFLAGNGASNPSLAHSGSYNACLKDNNTADTKTRLITPRLNLANVSDPVLSFWHTQAVFITYQDRLTVYYRNSATGPWVSIGSFTTNVPVWTQRTIALPNPTNDYYIAFEGNAKRGYGVCIDDVEVTGVMPDSLELQNMTIGSDHCYNALETIALAGNGTNFTVTNGAHVTLIAGQKIVFYPGTHLQLGGNLSAAISMNGQYCGTLPSSSQKSMNNSSEKPFPMSTQFRIYPNPTSGVFVVDFPGNGPLSEPVKIEIYDIQGVRIFSTLIREAGIWPISLKGFPNGIYLLQIISGRDIESRKILKSNQ